MTKGITVLSLFDGMSCGQVALKRLGVKVDRYYASEIDPHAIKVTMKNHPETIQLGTVTGWREWDIPHVDLIIAGSPCQGFSFAGKQLAFDDPRSNLYFEFEKVLAHFRGKNPDIKFLLENVVMQKKFLDVITERLAVEPEFINSRLVSAQNRQRYYWANWTISQPEDRGILLQDILECQLNPDFVPKKIKNLAAVMAGRTGSRQIEGVSVNENGIRPFKNDGRKGGVSEIGRIGFPGGKSSAITCAHVQKVIVTGGRIVGRKINPATGRRDDYNPDLKAVQMLELRADGKAGCMTTVQKDSVVAYDEITYRPLTITEAERLQTLDDGYTDGVPESRRFHMIGNGWTVEAIVHILGLAGLPRSDGI